MFLNKAKITVNKVVLSILLIILALPIISIAAIPTEPNLKIAFIGDTGYGSNFISVLNLIKTENASAVIHLGDFDYIDSPSTFFGVVDSNLGLNYPYFTILGNHDEPKWATTNNPSYAQFTLAHINRNGIVLDNPDINDQMYSFVYRGLKVVFTGEGGASTGDNIYAPYIENQLKNDDHIWKISGWHKVQNSMQVGEKTDEAGWKVYETSRKYGAIIATAHEHSYERTRTLINFSTQTVDPITNSPTDLNVGPNRTFAFVSGLGGKDIRDQSRCLPHTYPYGCKGEWASIYTSNQGANYGALFIIFNYDGNPNHARGYFKNINGQIIDEFNITDVGNRGFINGTVRDSSSHFPSRGAIVTTNTSVTTTTNEFGFYSLFVPYNTYNITIISEPRYFHNNSVTVFMTETNIIHDVELLEKPTGNISGSVVKAYN